MTKENLTELIGCIIDTFEDDLHNRTVKPVFGTANIPLHFKDEDSDGVFYGGEYYDNVASQLKTLLKEFGIEEK